LAKTNTSKDARSMGGNITRSQQTKKAKADNWDAWRTLYLDGFFMRNQFAGAEIKPPRVAGCSCSAVKNQAGTVYQNDIRSLPLAGCDRTMCMCRYALVGKDQTR
jgi:hypothetical protein